MVSKKLVHWLLCAGMATAAFCAPWPADANAADRPEGKRLSVAEIEKLHAFLKPQPGESRWMEIDWYPNVWEGRQKAITEGKPLFLWAGSGGAPVAGC